MGHEGFLYLCSLLMSTHACGKRLACKPSRITLRMSPCLYVVVILWSHQLVFCAVFKGSEGTGTKRKRKPAGHRIPAVGAFNAQGQPYLVGGDTLAAAGSPVSRWVGERGQNRTFIWSCWHTSCTNTWSETARTWLVSRPGACLRMFCLSPTRCRGRGQTRREQ